ncbi:hypothetical protein NIES4071_50720 [Calothrix sp. NIES-4071]|nr:hypothetical protein NIES4071_50720 [Calothrix sp. NIES-4071]BAZ59380.1 hypothetical protein NIES4105_50670 [Calothrix sp. NIES-4105]
MSGINITIPDKDLQQLQEIAASRNMSMEDLILLGIRDLLNSSKYALNQNVEDSSEVAKKFYTLASQWESEVEGMSSTTQMSQHPAYQEIISMGNKIVPLLLKELKNNPLYWLSALSQITGENPIKPEQRGKIKQMAEAWLEWGKNQGYVI